MGAKAPFPELTEVNMARAGDQSFVFTGENIVTPDGHTVRLQNSEAISRKCEALLQEYDELGQTRGFRLLVNRLTKIYALSRELVKLLTTNERRLGHKLPWVYMKPNGDLEFSDRFEPQRLEGEFFKIISPEDLHD